MAGRASGVKMGDDKGVSLITPDGVVPIWMVGVFASVISRCTIKVQNKIFLWHWLTQIVPDKWPWNGCVCVYVCVCFFFIYGRPA